MFARSTFPPSRQVLVAWTRPRTDPEDAYAAVQAAAVGARRRVRMNEEDAKRER